MAKVINLQTRRKLQQCEYKLYIAMDELIDALRLICCTGKNEITISPKNRLTIDRLEKRYFTALNAMNSARHAK